MVESVAAASGLCSQATSASPAASVTAHGATPEVPSVSGIGVDQVSASSLDEAYQIGLSLLARRGVAQLAAEVARRGDS